MTAAQVKRSPAEIDIQKRAMILKPRLYKHTIVLPDNERFYSKPR